MNSVAISALLAVIENALPLLPSSGSSAVSLIASIIKALETWVPIIVGEFKALVPIVKNIITVLKAKDAPITDEQWAILDALDAQCDADFEAAGKGIDPDAGDA